MVSYLGVDWASGCWLVVKTGDETLVTTEPSILNVWHEHGRRDDVQSMLVDIPIGLPESGFRACDEEATDRLTSRRNSVFSIPARDVVENDDYNCARKLNDDSLGSQSWWLFPRIQEVDVFLQEHEDAIEKIYESHPEICFAELITESLPKKDSEDGRRKRMEPLKDDPHLYDQVEEVISERKDDADWHNRISKGRLDDVVDAAVLALTGKKLQLGPRSQTGEYPALPEKNEADVDEKLKIRPEIVYPGIV